MNASSFAVCCKRYSTTACNDVIQGGKRQIWQLFFAQFFPDMLGCHTIESWWQRWSAIGAAILVTTD
jgi:hypothetical protein